MDQRPAGQEGRRQQLGHHRHADAIQGSAQQQLGADRLKHHGYIHFPRRAVSVQGLQAQAARRISGFADLDGLEFVAMISALLGFFNLLPLPALDGGRLVFLSIEVITRRRVNHRIEQIVHMVGMVILLGLMLLLVAKDVKRLIGF